MPKKKFVARVVFIHGVRWSKKDNRMLRLAVAFKEAGFCVVVPRYGFVPALLMGVFSWLDNRIADTMGSFILEDDILVGHSNGATLAYLISKRKKLRGAILVNAALETTELPTADFVHVYYNRGDCVAQWSAIIPFHPWGAMGGLGYEGPHCPSVSNIDQSNPPEPHLPPLCGHSDIFSPGKLRPWGRYMASRLLQALRNNK
ncbi:MAG TPA: hypothetical protein VF443_04765 [Nitrospira sp.]